MKQHQLVDAATHLHIQGVLSSDSSPSPSICPKDASNPYLNLLSEFPALTQVCFPDSAVMHDVTHHIQITGSPVLARPSHFAPGVSVWPSKSSSMLQLGIICPSSSAWSSPLHMVPKKTAGDWHPCGDYCALNRTYCPRPLPCPPHP